MNKKKITLGMTLMIIGMSTMSTSYAACKDPVGAVVNVLDCIEKEKALCAASGYANNFIEMHNGLDTNTPKPNYFFWFGAFYFTDFKLAIDHITKVDHDQISLRYVEKVTFNDGDVFYQHEHALVTVNNSCKIMLWDQYGDNAEQKAVQDKADQINPF